MKLEGFIEGADYVHGLKDEDISKEYRFKEQGEKSQIERCNG